MEPAALDLLERISEALLGTRDFAGVTIKFPASPKDVTAISGYITDLRTTLKLLEDLLVVHDVYREMERR